MTSSYTEPKNRQVLLGPVHSGSVGRKSSSWSRCAIRARRWAGTCSESQPRCHGIARSVQRGDRRKRCETSQVSSDDGVCAVLYTRAHSVTKVASLSLRARPARSARRWPNCFRRGGGLTRFALSGSHHNLLKKNSTCVSLCSVCAIRLAPHGPRTLGSNDNV